jgi:hypothetical protein
VRFLAIARNDKNDIFIFLNTSFVISSDSEKSHEAEQLTFATKKAKIQVLLHEISRYRSKRQKRGSF